jgi:hypothetical protein
MSKAIVRRRSRAVRRRNPTGDVAWGYLLGGAATGAVLGGAVGAFQGYQAFHGPLATNETRTGTASGAMLARGSAYAEFGALGGWALGGIVGGNPIFYRRRHQPVGVEPSGV